MLRSLCKARWLSFFVSVFERLDDPPATIGDPEDPLREFSSSSTTDLVVPVAPSQNRGSFFPSRSPSAQTPDDRARYIAKSEKRRRGIASRRCRLDQVARHRLALPAFVTVSRTFRSTCARTSEKPPPFELLVRSQPDLTLRVRQQASGGYNRSALTRPFAKSTTSGGNPSRFLFTLPSASQTRRPIPSIAVSNARLPFSITCII